MQSWSGRWWLPSHEDNVVFGEVRVGSDDFALHVDGLLAKHRIKPPRPGPIPELFIPITEEAIWGRTVTGEKLTLLDCEGYLPAIPATEGQFHWRPGVVLVGAHLQVPATFSGVHTELGRLLDWTGQGFIGHSIGPAAKTVSATAKSVTVGKSSVPNGKIELVNWPSWLLQGSQRTQIESHSEFRVELSTPTGWREAIDTWITPFRDLISFATTRPSWPASIRLRPEGADKLVDTFVRIATPPGTTGPDRRLVPPDVLFLATDLPKPFGAWMKKWFSVYKEFNPVFRRMLRVGYTHMIHEDERFLLFARAAETLDSVERGDQVRPTADHRNLVKAATANIEDADVNKWAKEILRPANFYTFRSRLERLQEQLDDIWRLVVDPKLDDFITKIVSTRNYLTHHKENKDNVLFGEDRYHYGNALHWLVRAELLRLLEFPDAEISQILQRHFQFKTLQ